MFTLDTCAHIVGSHVISYDTEKELLVGWRAFIEKVDPDVVIGYNIANFDLPYLLDRSRALNIEGQFALLGRLKGMSHVL